MTQFFHRYNTKAIPTPLPMPSLPNSVPKNDSLTGIFFGTNYMTESPIINRLCKQAVMIDFCICYIQISLKFHTLLAGDMTQFLR